MAMNWNWSGRSVPCWALKKTTYFYHIYSYLSKMRSSRNIKLQRINYSRNGSRKSRRPRRLTVENTLLRLAETKVLTESSHHFPLVTLSAITYSDSGIFTDGWTCTNRVAQGTSNNQRIGNAMTTVLIHYKFNLFANTNNPDTVRIMTILDLAPKGTVPLLGNVFDDPTNNLSSLAPNSTRQYKMLHDKLVDVGGSTQTVSHTFTIRRQKKTRYFGTNSDLASIKNNAIYIIVISVNGQPTECLNYWSSLVYKDI